MAINYLIKWVEDLEDTFVNTKDFAKALAVKETSDYFKTDHYKEKVINLRSKVSRTRITSIVDIIELIKGLSKDTDLPRMFAIEQAISFVDNFEEHKESIIVLMKTIDKHLRTPVKSKIFEKLGIKYTVKRSNTLKPAMHFSELFEGSDGKVDVHIRNWQKRLPYWNINYDIPIDAIRVRDNLKMHNDESFDFAIPYNGRIILSFKLQCINVHKFFFGNITKIEHYKDNVQEACFDLFNEHNRLEEYRWFRDTQMRMIDNNPESNSWERFNGNVHPYMSRSLHREGQAGNYCTGDIEDDLNESYRNLEFERLGLVVKEWLSNFTVGHTGPMNNINNYLMGGISEDAGRNVNKYHLESSWQHNCFDNYMKDHRTCDAINCAFRTYCEPYIKASGSPDTTERTVENLMKKHDSWLINFQTNYDTNHRTEIENYLVNSSNADDFNFHMEELGFAGPDIGLALTYSQFQELKWYFENLNREGSQSSATLTLEEQIADMEEFSNERLPNESDESFADHQIAASIAIEEATDERDRALEEANERMDAAQSSIQEGSL